MKTINDCNDCQHDFNLPDFVATRVANDMAVATLHDRRKRDPGANGAFQIDFEILVAEVVI